MHAVNLSMLLPL